MDESNGPDVIALTDENRTLKAQVESLKQAIDLLQVSESKTADDEKVSKLQGQLDAERTLLKELRSKLDATTSVTRHLADAKAELVQLTDSYDKVKSERDKLKEVEDEIVSKTKSEIDALNRKLKSASRNKAQAQSQLASVKADLDGKAKEVEELSESSKILKEERDSLLKKVEHLSSSESLAREKLTESETSVASLQEEVSKSKSENKSLQDSMDELRRKLNDTVEENTSIKADLDMYKNDLDEKVTQHKIAAKKSVQLIKELKSQLQKESEKCAMIEESKNTLEDQHKQEVHRLREKVSQNMAHNGDGISPKTVPTEDDGVKRALAKRLESLLNENQALKEKVSFLEQSIVSLNEDLIQLRAAKTKALLKTEEATDDEEEIFI
mmetsp:Transcript_8319/g.9534  ORF Transcript_8319/g.9534 Transcript_8319/m.9534 type:complete len:385 (+) Transcript_8319:164-1318(+)